MSVPLTPRQKNWLFALAVLLAIPAVLYTLRYPGSARLRADSDRLRPVAGSPEAGARRASGHANSEVGSETARTDHADDPGGGASPRLNAAETSRPAVFILSGSVLNIRGAGLEGAEVELEAISSSGRVATHPSGSAPRKTRADRDGSFRFDQTTAGRYRLLASAPGHVPALEAVDVPTSGVELRLKPGPGAVMEGNVFLRETGEGVAGAVVRAHGIPYNGREAWRVPPDRQVVTDPLGGWRLSGLLPGRYTLTADKRTTSPPASLRSVPPSRPLTTSPAEAGTLEVELTDGATTSGITLLVSGGVRISGTVSDHRNGKPLAGARVFWITATGSIAGSESDATGRYLLLIPQGERNGVVTAVRPGWSLFLPREGRGISAHLSPAAARAVVNLSMLPTPLLSGHVLKQSDRTPVAGASVRARTLHAGETEVLPQPVAVTDADGRFSLPATPFLRTILLAETTHSLLGPGKTAVLQVPEAGLQGVEILLPDGRNVSGVVVDSGDSPVEGARVRASMGLVYGSSFEDYKFREVRSDAEGRFVLERLAAGNGPFSLFAQKEGYAPSNREGAGPDGGEVRLVLPPGHFLAGRVLDTDGRTVAGAKLGAWSLASIGLANFAAESDATGRYRFQDLPAGKVSVSAQFKGYPQEYAMDLDVDRDDADIILGKKGFVTLIGRAIDGQTGSPVEEFDVSLSAYSYLDPGAYLDPDRPGVFYARGKAKEKFYCVINSPGYARLSETVPAPADDAKVVEHTFALGHGGVLRGRVVEEGTSRPLEGFRVDAHADHDSASIASAITDQAGEFQLEEIPVSNDIPLKVYTPDGVEAVADSFAMGEGEVKDVGDLVVRRRVDLRVHLVQEPGDTPVAGVTVYLSPSGVSELDREALTGPDGIALFPSVHPTRSGRLYLRKPGMGIGYDPESVPNRSNGLDLFVRIGTARLHGSLTRPGAATEFRITATPGASLQPPLSSLEFSGSGTLSGGYSVDGLPAGTYDVKVRPDDYSQSSATLTCTLQTGEERVADFTLP